VGRIALITDNFRVDSTPPNRVTVTVSWANTLHQTQPITRGQTLTDAASLSVA